MTRASAVTLRVASGAAAAAACVLLASCMTVNHLDLYQFDGARLAVNLDVPPEPQLRMDYDVRMDGPPVIAALSVVTNLAKANQAVRTREVMRAALVGVDVPAIVRTESFAACSKSLGTQTVDSLAGSDYVLSLRIEEWGIETRNPFAAVSLHMKLLVSLYPRNGSELAWRREITVDEPADPDMFGMGSIVGNMVTATVLYNMNQDDLARGFKELGSLTARRIAYELEGDLDRARFGG